MPAVDQQKIRRARTGLIAHDPDRAQPGYTLFAPMFGDGTVYLIDMQGAVAHTWRMPYRPGLYGHLLDNGHLFYGGKVMEDLGRFEAWPRFKAGAALEVDWEGRVVWEVRHPDHHHDARRLRNGNVLLLCLRPLPAEIAARVQGGLPGTEADGVIYADYLLEVTTHGEIVWEWRSWEHLDPAVHPITPQDRRAEWTHGNTVAETADGHVVVSFRNISTVAMIERATGKLAWTLGPPPLAQQHDPRPLPNGNLLVFDNGTHRRDHPATFSRVVEVDPRTREIVWQYTDPSLLEFFSPYISGAQRLANGNTLICEGCHGRIFEVTRSGEVVWEYVNPHFFTEPGAPGLNNWVFRAFRYTAEEIDAARRA
ncbi:MAG TPA: aryl-sulfate sulfotransferase [Candidatus Bathyarchaeia archaeon]|nr:aryl-sulfate sulfotransferase [Candidatus Bathyarchaeia archaeon]